MYGRISSLLILLLACAALLSGCKKDTQVNDVIGELDSFTKELVSKIESAQNPSAGVDDAQKFLDSRKADMKAKIDSIKELRGYQVSEDTMKKLKESVTDDAMSIAKLQIKYMQQTARDPAFKAKLDKLINDYQALLTV
jgi:ABC-type uncharacterized transport system auxiliary subunit